MSILGLVVSSVAALLLFQAAPTIDDTLDMIVTMNNEPAPTLMAHGRLIHYDRAMKRQKEMRNKTRCGLILLLAGFIIQGIAVFLQMP